MWSICVTSWTRLSGCSAPPLSRCTNHWWPLGSGVFINEGNWQEKKKRFTNNQSKGQDRAETWPYCSPIKTLRVLTDVKVQGRSVGCLLIGEKVSRDSSVGVCCTFHLHRRQNTLFLSAAPSSQMLLWTQLTGLKRWLHGNLPLGGVQVHLQVIISSWVH